MANPITPSGRARRTHWIDPDGASSDIVNDMFGVHGIDIREMALRQDEERRIREDEEYFARTGENRRPVSQYDPLVDNYDRRDIANDGDSYDDFSIPEQHAYVEESPSHLISESVAEASRRRAETIRSRENTSHITAEQQAYMKREKIQEDNKFQAKVEENKKKYKNAITGLEIDGE